jgi:hypothetical protein
MSDAGEIIKSGAADKLADIIHKLAGPMAEEFGAIFADKARVYRTKNWLKTAEKTERLLREAGRSPSAVPPRLLLPIAEACSVEDNETLQDMWAGLLATASQETDEVSPSFIETLKQLTPDQARSLLGMCDDTLRCVYPNSLPESLRQVRAITGVPVCSHPEGPEVSWEPYERLALIRREYELTKPGPEPLQLARLALRELDYDYVFTEYAGNFMQACEGPRPHPSGSGVTTLREAGG